MRPVPLEKGDLIAVAAPAGPFDRKRFHHGVFLLKKAGFGMAMRRDITARRSYLAGEDARRAAEMKEALAAPFSALLIARGGYGCQRIVPLLDGSIHPKIVMGSSDVTVLLIHLWKQYGMPSYYGPMVAPHLTEPRTVRRVARALTDPRFFDRQPIRARTVLKGGTAEGTLVGGCLSLVTATLGTPWELDTKGKILFLEDTNEEPYAVDRMLTQLEQAGKLRGVKGFVFGTFKRGKTLFPSDIQTVVREKLEDFRGPVLWGVRFGHCKDPLILPFGGEGRIRGDRLIVTRGIF